MSAERILAILDDCARAFVFPMLDNGYIYPAAARLSLYRSDADWALVFETFGYSPRAGEPDCFITTIASTIGARRKPNDFVSREAYEAYLANDPYWEQRAVQPLDQDAALYDSDCYEFIAASAHEVGVRGVKVAIPNDAALAAMGVERAKERLLVLELARYLAAHRRDLVLATDAEREVNLPAGVHLIARLDDWHHPDLVRDQLPSQTANFRAIATCLAGGPLDLATITADANTHWSNWPEGGSL